MEISSKDWWKSEQKGLKHRNHAAMGPKGGGHVSELPDKEQAVYLAQEANIGLGKAKSMVAAIRGYTNGDFYNIRIKKNDVYVRKAELLEEFIDKAPKFNGDVLYRGSHIQSNLAVFTKMKVGSVIGMRGVSSWSSDQKIAKQFSSSPGHRNYLFEMVGGTNKGASVSFIHDGEGEVLVSGKSKFKVESIEEVGKHKWDQLTIVKVREVGGSHIKSVKDIDEDVELEDKSYAYNNLYERWSLDSDLLELFHSDEIKDFTDIETKHRNHPAMGPKGGGGEPVPPPNKDPKDFSGQDLTGKDFSGQDLTGKDFSGQDLTGYNFKGANLSNANLTNTSLFNANLTNANLTNANLSNANLTNASLFYADLSNANLTNAHLIDANLISADLTRVNLSNANLTSANLTNTSLFNANLSNANLTNANLSDAHLTDANLSKANLTSANLTNANLTSANLIDANLSGVIVNGKPISNKFTNALKIQSILNNELKSHSSEENKEFVQSNIAKKTGLLKVVVKNSIHQWAETSGDNNELSIANQLAAKEIFGLHDAVTDHWPETTIKEAKQKVTRETKAFIQAQYDATQEYFKDAGIKEILVYRGVGSSYKGGDTVSLQPISSFSIDYNEASKFGTRIMASVVPVEKILSHPRTGFGCTNEKEVVVLGGNTNVIKVSSMFDANVLYEEKSQKSIGLSTIFKHLQNQHDQQTHGRGGTDNTLDSDYLKAVESGDLALAGQMVLEAAKKSGLPLLEDDEKLSFSYRRDKDPIKTVKAYKLFKADEGKLYPMFVGSKSVIPVDVWLDAKGESSFVLDSRGRKRVEATTGEWTTLQDGRKTKTLAFRPGWHSGDLPYAIQNAPKNELGQKSRYANDVWAEIEIGADKEYAKEAMSNASITRTGHPNAKEAQLDHIPKDGFYPYKTNTNAIGQWYISGSIKIKKILTEDEVNKVLKDKGIAPMPWIGGKQNLEKYGIIAGEKTTTSKLLDPVTYDNDGHIIPLSQRFNPKERDIKKSLGLSTIFKGGVGSGIRGHRTVYNFSPLKQENLKFPPISDDPAPGKDYYYHATAVTNLKDISGKDLLPPSMRPISLAPHLESVRYWGGQIGRDKAIMALLRVNRNKVKIEKHEEDDDYNPHDESAEDATYQKISAHDLEFYMNGRWHALLPKQKSLGLSAIFKGGVGSGIRGHRTIRQATSKLTPKQRAEALARLQAQATQATSVGDKIKNEKWNDVAKQMETNLKTIADGIAKHTATEGIVDAKHIKTIISNMRNEADLYTKYLASDTAVKLRDFTSTYENILHEGIRNGEFKNLNSKDLDAFGIDSIKKMVHQEVESNRQQFTDHGIRHVYGNIERQLEIMDSMSDKVPAKDKLAALAIMVNHDIGYTSKGIRDHVTDPKDVSKAHKEDSSEMYNSQKSTWNENKLFTPKEFDRVAHAIKTHDSSEMDKDPLLTSTRIADNLALFAKEKLPSMFKYVEGGQDYLVKMGIAAKKGNTKDFESLRDGLYRTIDSSDLNVNLKRDLKAGTREISLMTPKFTLGVLAGEISDISGDKKGKVNVTVKYSAYDAFLQNHFDMGQKQTKKLLGDYGITDFSKTDYHIGDRLSVKVEGYSAGKKEYGLGRVVKHRNHPAMGPKGGTSETIQAEIDGIDA